MILSVVIIVYNLEKFIIEALFSVLNQTRQADEIILVDDCSTDSSFELVSQFNNQIKILRMPTNSGALLTALEGVKNANGDIICMLDGDDTWALNKLEVIEEEFLQNEDLILLSHQHVRVNKDGEDLKIKDDTHENIEGILKATSNKDNLDILFRDTILSQKGYWLGSAYSFRKRAFDIKKFIVQLEKFNKGQLRDTYLDLVIAPFLVLTNPKKIIGYTNRTSFFYRIHGAGSLSDNSSVQKAIKSLEKGRTTNKLIFHILKNNNSKRQYLKRRLLILKEYDFLEDLYLKKYLRALKKFYTLSRFLWSNEKKIKELIRISSILLIGPKKFLEKKNRR